MTSEHGDKSERGYVNDGGWTTRRIVFLSIALGLAVVMIWLAREILLPFILGLVIAYVLTPLVALCERRRLPRSVSILLVYAIVLGALYWGISAVAPRIFRETVSIVRELPRIANHVAHVAGPRIDTWVDRVAFRSSEPEVDSQSPAFEIRPLRGGGYGVSVGAGVEITQETANRYRIEPLGGGAEKGFSFTRMLEGSGARAVDYVKKNAFELINLGRQIVQSASHGVFLVFMTLMVGGYLMYTREQVIGFFRGLMPWRARGGFDRLLFRFDRGLSGVVRGQLLICLVNGVLTAIAFSALGVKYWAVLALVAALGSLIPIFGSVAAAVPAVVIGLMDHFWQGVWVLLAVLFIHQVEANFLNPKIIGTAARIHPVLVVFVLILGEHYFGLWGALFAVPAWSMVQSLFLHFRALVVPDVLDTVLPLWRANEQESRPPEAPPSA